MGCLNYPNCNGARPMTMEFRPGVQISPEVYNRLFGNTASGSGSRPPQEWMSQVPPPPPPAPQHFDLDGMTDEDWANIMGNEEQEEEESSGLTEEDNEV